MQRGKCESLPAADRAWLDNQLVCHNFSDYDELAAMLTARGYKIGKSSVHRYGQHLERRMSAIRASTEAAKAIATAAPDDADARSEALMSLLQTDLFDLLLVLQESQTADPAKRVALLGKLAKSVADLSRASVGQKKHANQIRDELRQQLAVEAANAAEKAIIKAGVSAETAADARAELLGVRRR